MEEMLGLEQFLALEWLLALEDFRLQMMYKNIITTESAAIITNAAAIVIPNCSELSTVAIRISMH